MALLTVEECFYEIRNGANIKQGIVDGGYPITRIETLSDDKFNRDRMGYAGITNIDQYKDYVLCDGDLLMSHINSPKYLGRTVMYRAEEEETIIHGMNLLRLKARRDIVEPAFAELLFYSPRVREQIGKITKKSVNQASFSVSDLKKIKVDIPSLEEQRSIVEKIDKLKTILGVRRTELEQLELLIKARFVEMFGDPDYNSMEWSEVALSECLDVFGGYAFKSDMFDENIGIPILRIGNINAGYFKPVNMVYWKEDEKLERYAIYPGDLVMSLTGTVGKDDYGNVCILGNEYDKYYLNQRNAKLEIRDGIDKYYLSELLRFEGIKKRLTGISRGVRQANISNKDILNLVVPIPPMELQEQFAAFVAQVDKSKAAAQKALDEVQLLFDSLMQEYFG
jgi:type I restriction enzyme S subunit